MKIDLSADEVSRIIQALRGSDDGLADEVERQFERQVVRNVRPGDSEGINPILERVREVESGQQRWLDDDARTKAVLAVEKALPEADRERILDKFRNTNLNGAAVADILDILDNHDALLVLREPFYDAEQDNEVRLQLGWPNEPDRVASRLIGYSALAVALLTDAVPTAGAVARLTREAHRSMIDG